MTTPKEQLQQAIDDQWRRNHPNIPEYAMPKPKKAKSPTNQLTADIVNFIRLKGGHVSRVNTMGIMRNGKYTTGGGTIGASDLSIIMRNSSGKIIAWELEVKVGKDFQRPEQKVYQESVERAGGIYSVCKTFDQFLEQYSSVTA